MYYYENNSVEALIKEESNIRKYIAKYRKNCTMKGHSKCMWYMLQPAT